MSQPNLNAKEERKLERIVSFKSKVNPREFLVSETLSNAEKQLFAAKALLARPSQPSPASQASDSANQT